MILPDESETRESVTGDLSTNGHKSGAEILASIIPNPASMESSENEDAGMAEFWEKRPILKHIYTAALAQQMDPRGVLAVELVRAICSIPPYVTLPGITAARASLNLHAALCGPSSGGKSSSVAVARMAIAITPEPEETTLGSAEGIAKQYAYWDGKKKEIVTTADTLLFNDTEIESVEALSKRGASLMSQWRKTFTGEQLGFGFASREHRIPIRAHKYRFGQILGIQHEMAEWLLKGTQKAAGTPQRILWAPVVYPEMPRPEDLPELPEQLALPEWPALNQPTEGDEGMRLKWSCGGAGVDKYADEELLREHELKVPEDIWSIVRQARWKFHHGEVDDLSGHSTVTRLKVAAGLMWLDGRTDAITMEDWDLAGVVMAVSDATRAEVQKTLDNRAADTNIARALAEGQRAGVVDDMKRDRAMKRVANGCMKWLQREDNGKAVNVLMRRFSGDDKQYLWPALEYLEKVRKVIELRAIDYKGQQGYGVFVKGIEARRRGGAEAGRDGET
jgi:hypothetical protein